jgi:hypothetical protein
MIEETTVTYALRAAGAGQILLGCVHPIAARNLNWREEAKRVHPMNARIFITLFLYISGLNIAFGLLGLFGPHLLLDGTLLATLVLGFITLYWSVRLILQLTYYRWQEVKNWMGSAPARHTLTLGVACFVAAHGLALAYVLTSSPGTGV